jgi:hypothetical protein
LSEKEVPRSSRWQRRGREGGSSLYTEYVINMSAKRRAPRQTPTTSPATLAETSQVEALELGNNGGGRACAARARAPSFASATGRFSFSRASALVMGGDGSGRAAGETPPPFYEPRARAEPARQVVADLMAAGVDAGAGPSHSASGC